MASALPKMQNLPKRLQPPGYVLFKLTHCLYLPPLDAATHIQLITANSPQTRIKYSTVGE